MEDLKKGTRLSVLRSLGYRVQYQGRSDEGIEYARKDIRDSWDYQHHKYNGKGWLDFDIYSKRGILSTMSDEEFNKWIDSLPELEKKAHEGFAEWLKDAEYQESIKNIQYIAENNNQYEDRKKLITAQATIMETIKTVEFKSIRFNHAFDSIIERLNQLSEL